MSKLINMEVTPSDEHRRAQDAVSSLISEEMLYIGHVCKFALAKAKSKKETWPSYCFYPVDSVQTMIEARESAGNPDAVAAHARFIAGAAAWMQSSIIHRVPADVYPSVLANTDLNAPIPYEQLLSLKQYAYAFCGQHLAGPYASKGNCPVVIAYIDARRHKGKFMWPELCVLLPLQVKGQTLRLTAQLPLLPGQSIIECYMHLMRHLSEQTPGRFDIDSDEVREAIKVAAEMMGIVLTLMLSADVKDSYNHVERLQATMSQNRIRPPSPAFFDIVATH